MTEVCHNLQQADAGSFHRNSGWYGFPAIHKKKRTEIVRRNSLRDRFFSTKIVRQKRTKAPTRLRDLASLIEIGKGAANHAGASAATFRVEHKLESLQETHTCLEVAVACNNFTSSTLKTKKRSRRSVIRNTSVQNFDLATQPRGPPLAITWKSLSPIDSITEQLSELNLNTQISEASSRNLSMAYRSLYQEQRALVPYQSHGAIVPLDGSFHQINRQPRAKVDLDDETTRVWNLLLENINSEGIDGTDEEKRKWWEAERRVFKGRADSFIARMHLVQGDRRFSPWKGSVADSVVGVFLTQNVTDHLSSSAFMSLVAKFPPKSKKQPEGGIEVQNNSPSVEETMLQELGDDDVRKLGGNKSPGSSTDGSIPRPHESTVQSPDTFEHVPVVSRESGTNKSSPIEDGKDKEDGLLSQTLEISSQGSANSPTAHTAEISESRLRSTSQEPTAWTKSNGFTGSTVSVHALQVAGTVQHDVPEKEANGEKNRQVQCGSLGHNLQNEQNLVNILSHEKLTPLDGECSLCLSPNLDTLETADLSQESVKGLSPSNIENGTCGAATLLSESASQMTTSSLEEDSDALEPAELSQERAGLLSHSSIENETCVAEALGLLSESASHVTTASRKEGPQFHASIGVEDEMHKMVGDRAGHASAENFLVENHSEMQEVSDVPSCSQNSKAIMESCIEANNVKMSECKEVSSNKNDVDYNPREKDGNKKGKEAKTSKRENTVDWDRLRDHAKAGGRQREKTPNTMDSVDWDAVRCADVKEVAEAIKERGMNNVLAGRIQDFLNRIVKDHGSIDLEWLRDVPPDRAKEYLLSVRGLGLKSVECVRLLTLHHLAFPVDTNVGRIAVRLGWVPLQPLPESLQLHLLELYPLLETIQKYLWPRLCKLDQKTLYELHYQMITFGKVFCTKSKPNCNACPMRGECRHFASAFASARLSLPAPDEKSMVTTTTTADDKLADQDLQRSINPLQLPSIQTDVEFTVSNYQPIVEGPPSPQPVIEVPPSPPPVVEVPPSPEFVTEICGDIEDFCNEDSDEIPTIRLNMTEFTHNLKKIMQQTAELQEGDMSKALVALTAEAASIPAPKLKSVSRLRTEHQVYVLPDSHPLLEGLDVREPDDPSPYLLSIWTPGETINSTEPPKRQCTSQESEKLCNNETCSSCNSIREAISDTVRGTLLIPCRTAMRGSFPLNGTYFQVNEVFADHESSLSPMEIPRQWLWKLPRRPVYFGTSVTSIFRGLSTEGIQYCFWRGFVCVRGFERKTRAPRPLIARLHFPASKLNKGKGKTDEN